LELRLPTFFKTWFYFNKCGWNWQKMTKNWIFQFFWKSLILYCIRSKNVFNVFHDLKNVKKAEQSLKICQFWPILATFYEFKSHFEKVGRRSSDDLLKISYFLNLHDLEHPKSVTIFFHGIWVKLSLSMMWVVNL
jgi:hypothetical protein